LSWKSYQVNYILHCETGEKDPILNG
jgi:hypothetical protein